MAKSPKNQTANVPPPPREIRSTQPVPTAPPPEANTSPTKPGSGEDATTETVAALQAARADVQRANVQQATVDVKAQANAGVDQTVDVPQGNTPPPVGIPTPDPVIDKLTVTKQARTYLDDSFVIANERLAPADSAMIDQLISEKFDSGVTDPADLAEQVAAEQDLAPTWDDSSGIKTLKISPA
jgi:hypothetical protein